MLHDAHRQLAEVHDLERRLDSAGFAPSQDEKTFDKPGQTVDFLEHASDDLSVGRSTEGSLQRHLAHATNGGERRAKLMRGVRGKPTKLLERRLEAREGLIEHPGELAELVLDIPHGQPLGQ